MSRCPFCFDAATTSNAPTRVDRPERLNTVQCGYGVKVSGLRSQCDTFHFSVYVFRYTEYFVPCPRWCRGVMRVLLSTLEIVCATKAAAGHERARSFRRRSAYSMYLASLCRVYAEWLCVVCMGDEEHVCVCVCVCGREEESCVVRVLLCVCVCQTWLSLVVPLV